MRAWLDELEMPGPGQRADSVAVLVKLKESRAPKSSSGKGGHFTRNLYFASETEASSQDAQREGSSSSGGPEISSVPEALVNPTVSEDPTDVHKQATPSPSPQSPDAMQSANLKGGPSGTLHGDRLMVPRISVSASEPSIISEPIPDPQPLYTYVGKGLVPIVDDDGASLDSMLRDYEIEGVDGRYWTEKLLRHILTRDRICAELKKTEYGVNGWQIQDLVDMVHPQVENAASVSYLKIFALLILAERVEDLAKFIDGEVSDDKLPVIIQKGRRWPVCLKTKPHQPLSCFQHRGLTDKEGFERNQWSVTVPFFDLTKENTCKEFELHRSSIRPWRRLEESGINHDSGGSVGAYGTVARVQFHPTSHSFHEVLPGIELDRNILAIKTLHDMGSDHEGQFRQELEQLKRFSGFVHEHLVTALGAFKRNGLWNFIFPSADCDLDEYLDRPAPPWNKKTVRWASKQLSGLMGALDTIHDPKHLHDPDKRYGRHGDIKCDKILCFRAAGTPDEYIFVISDFGLSRFNRDTSRSNIPNKLIPTVTGYRPPECDIEGGLISRAYDIWTIGCLYLEFLTWLLGGPQLLHEFRDKRMDMYITGVKPQVTEWIQMLRRHGNCSRFVHEVLDLIQTEMLVVLEDNGGKSPPDGKPSSGKRSSSGELRKKLDSIRFKCSQEIYSTQGVAGKEERLLLAPAVEATLNSFATHMILNHEVPLQEHRGETGTSMSPDQFRLMDSPHLDRFVDIRQSTLCIRRRSLTGEDGNQNTIEGP
ncbi:hypothetical protein B0J13DRAFT_619724 [Dactylonectria estremocensis]|uniref:Protein kinase domain-containing protein n=1 Tax=Dactylonectria estremocensis TaxID=1079267 RepID=A0A9P9JCJ3_9HYPO|nr:hypothetical protein B0J13DRAFT_619724 [Dactylonectria estremocensis]